MLHSACRTRHCFAVEIDPTLRRFLGDAFRPDRLGVDVCSIDPNELPPVDIVSGGFPCQPFSSAGKGAGFLDARSSPFHAIVRYLHAARPLVYILENVVGLLSHEGGATWSVVLEALEAVPGYALHHRILDASDFGVAQSRRRVYIVGIRTDGLTSPLAWPSTTARPLFWELLELHVRGGPADRADLAPASARTLASTLHRLELAGADPACEPWVVDLDCSLSRVHPMLARAPCLLRSHRRGSWVTCLSRRLL